MVSHAVLTIIFFLSFLTDTLGSLSLSLSLCFSLSVSLTRALLQADVIMLLGARLNWILHFGLPPRFHPQVKVIQVQ